MAKLPRIKQEIFGSEAGPQDIGVVGSLHEGNPTYALTTEQIQSLDAFKRGLRSVVIGENSPILEEDNGMYKLITQQLAYILQNGIPEWDANTTYYKGAVVMYPTSDTFFKGASFFQLTFQNESTGEPPNPDEEFVWVPQYSNPQSIPELAIHRSSLRWPEINKEEVVADGMSVISGPVTDLEICRLPLTSLNFSNGTFFVEFTQTLNGPPYIPRILCENTTALSGALDGLAEMPYITISGWGGEFTMPVGQISVGKFSQDIGVFKGIIPAFTSGDIVVTLTIPTNKSKIRFDYVKLRATNI